MPNNISSQARVRGVASNRSAVQLSNYTGVNTTRQDRSQARELRRRGDWSYLEVPAPVLWLDDPFVVSPFAIAAVFASPFMVSPFAEEVAESAAFVDIWG
jgi:hypothetical protein